MRATARMSRHPLATSGSSAGAVGGRELMKKTEVDRELTYRICIPELRHHREKRQQQQRRQQITTKIEPGLKASRSTNQTVVRLNEEQQHGCQSLSRRRLCCSYRLACRGRGREGIKEPISIGNVHLVLASGAHQMGSSCVLDSGSPSKLHNIATASESFTSLEVQFRRRRRKKTIERRPLLLSFLLLISLLLLLLVQTESQVVAAAAVGETEISSSVDKSMQDDKFVSEIGTQTIIHTKQGSFRGTIISQPGAGGFQPPEASQVTNGDTIESQVVGFLGIRYASAPVRRLRFMPPTAYNYAPNQTHHMNKFGPICRQRLPLDVTSISQVIENNHQIPGGGGSSQADSLERIMRHHSITNQVTDQMMGSESNETHYRGRQDNTSRSISDTNSSRVNLQLLLTKSLLPKESFAHLRPIIERLSRLEQSEDCLSLNIYVPRSGGPLPVLVVIHGDSFDFGAGALIDGARLVHRHRRLIVVTFNFRLNILGFPPKLAGASRGNLGLMDQVAALHWIRDNVASFGGSPSNITLMGTKKGAIFVSLLMLSPLAKGLFQRSIMEDGSALTPLVANHIIAVVPSQQLNFSPAIQHVRLLARLCDCPLLPSAGTRQPANSSTSVSRQPTGSSSQQQQQQQLAGFAEEAKLNALTFECLRHKPVEQILQPIPLNLLHLNQLNGEITLTDRANKLTSAHQLDQPDMVTSTSTATSSLDSRQVGKLLSLAIREQLSNLSEERADTTDELFSAIFGPQTGTSIRLPFGPVVDGTIVPDEDLAASMLKSGSSFAQRDLLIGLRRPSAGAPLTNNGQRSATDALETDHLPVSDHLVAERITGHLQRTGITSDQALEFVGLFVRSFYRYHNQEITNSIISNYLMNGNAKRFKKVRKTNQVPQNVSQFADSHYEDDNQIKASEQQLHTLESIVELLQDALTSVPLLKTTLIHATKQLEPLVDVLVGQQFGKWKEQRQQDQQNRLLIAETPGEPVPDHKSLFDTFTSFAQSLFSNPQWPLELHSARSNMTVIQPKATYLFQIDESLYLRDIQVHLERLESIQHHQQQLGWKSIRDTLRALFVRLQSTHYRDRLSFGCALEAGIINGDENDLASRLISKLCERLGSVLFNFISTGNVNDPARTMEDSNIIEKVAQFEVRCLTVRAGDLDSVRLSDTPSAELDADCRRELNSLTLDYLFAEQDSRDSQRWPVFDLFSQQVATLPTTGESLWHLSRISDEPDQFDRERTLLARSSFWSNFIPALNCSRTLPILPVSSPSSSSINSSALLNLNLVFSCQQSGAKTPLDSIHSLVSYIGKQLKGMILRWSSIEVAKTNTSQQNHHNLRMANMSQSELEQHQQAELSEEQQQQHKLVTSSNDSSQLFSRFSPKIHDPTSSPGDTVQVGRAGLVLVICGLVLCFTVASGACAMMWQRKSPRRNSKQSNPSQSGARLSSKQQQQHSSSQAESSPEQVSSSLNNEEPDIGISMSQQPVHEKQAITPIMLIESETEYNESVELPAQNSSSSHVCSLNQFQPTVHFQNHEQFHINGNHMTHQLMHQGQQLVTSESMDEPIMVPLLNAPLTQFHQEVPHLPSCLVHSTNNVNNYEGSISEVQSSTLNSSSKKRVKISDPLGTSRREPSRNNSNLQPNTYGVQVERDQLPYCLLHGRNISQSASMELQPTGYYTLENGSYIDPANVQFWPL